MMGLSTKQVSSTDGSEWSQSALLLQPPPPPQQQILHPTTTTKPPPPRDPTSRSRNQTNQLGNNQPEPLKCPRCDSGNTKFCYYNNYNKSQPRHFCKSCKRHWTNGGTLRNVPVGGGRKNKRPSHSKPSAAGRIISKVIQAQQSKKPKQSRGSSSNDVVLFNHPTLPPSPIAPPAESDSVAEFDDDEAGGVGFVLTQAMSFPNYSAPSSAAAFDGEFLGLPPTWQVPSTIVGGSGDVSDITAAAAETAATATGGGYWNWDVDMDTLVSSADLNIPWDDDSEIKP